MADLRITVYGNQFVLEGVDQIVFDAALLDALDVWLDAINPANPGDQDAVDALAGRLRANTGSLEAFVALHTPKKK